MDVIGDLVDEARVGGGWRHQVLILARSGYHKQDIPTQRSWSELV